MTKSMAPVLDISKSANPLVLVSGGLDSCVLLAWAKEQYGQASAITFDYGATHGHAEQVASIKICRALGVERVRVVVPHLFGPSALTGDKQSNSNVVPARNLVFMALATARGVAAGNNLVLIGSCADDHADFPDCRPPFFMFLARSMEIGTGNVITNRAPFTMMAKSEVIRMGLNLGAPLHLTHTCYKGVQPACGECQSCRTRLAAFEKLGVMDPLEYVRAPSEQSSADHSGLLATHKFLFPDSVVQCKGCDDGLPVDRHGYHIATSGGATNICQRRSLPNSIP